MPLKGESQYRKTYEIRSHLPGGKGTIVVANHEIFGRLCVQKVADLHGSEGELAFQEPRLLDRINHPHITPIGEVQFDPDRPQAITFIMPLYEGGSVDYALVEPHRFSLHEALDIARNISDALDYLHTTMGYVHRDMKPGNVLMAPGRREGFLSDFGSAAKIEGDGKVPATPGTLFYLPPEARPLGRLGPEVDVYGLGLILFEMVNGRLRWEDVDGATMQLRLVAGKRAMPDRMLEKWAPHVPDRLKRVIRKAIRREPERRYKSAREFLGELNAIRCVDWIHAEGEGLDGKWAGTWPPGVRAGKRVSIEIESRLLKAGQRKGERRLVARYRRVGVDKWRGLLSPETLGSEDAAGVAQFFRAVEAKLAQRTPAR
jgi:serine/threonine protein kinase